MKATLVGNRFQTSGSGLLENPNVAFAGDESRQRTVSVIWAEFPTVVTGVRAREPALSFACADHLRQPHDLVRRFAVIACDRGGLLRLFLGWLWQGELRRAVASNSATCGEIVRSVFAGASATFATGTDDDVTGAEVCAKPGSATRSASRKQASRSMTAIKKSLRGCGSISFFTAPRTRLTH